ncbi:MAG TPA: hypothetical protein VMX97_08815 [Hyphomicrobiaceae bacterium]|jgi:hypothetical protein|nr:hypothetical protein [Hyphomicrobiaceae bacterium]
MKIKLLTSMAGIDFSHNSGDIIDVDDAEYVRRLVENGIGEIVDQPAAVETATKKTATRKAAK